MPEVSQNLVPDMADAYPVQVQGPKAKAVMRELAGDAVRGIAVHTGARVAAQAGPSEVLVSQTVKDLVAGSGIELEDRGAHELKGVPGEWRLYAVR